MFRRSGARIIAHRAEAARMVRLGSEQAQAVITTLQLRRGSVQPPAPPDQIIDGDIILELSNLELHIIHLGTASPANSKPSISPPTIT